MAGHETVRSTDLSALQGIFFEELDNLMALDINGDDEAIEREINRAKAVSDVGARAIENANTAVAMAKLNEAIVAAELRPRKCPCCGRTYRPQYRAQRTCRECLDSGRKAKRSYGFVACAKCGATFEKLSARGKYCPKCRKKNYGKER